jgi:2-polyprenyl-3-methyl-5-hydroxy-6-metoxy-1,4-benzoquinol methylase
VVSLIDVLHHVPPGRQRAFFAGAVARVRTGGILLYKDMCRSPLWRAWANRAHDLLLARQWIHYVPLARLEAWAAEEGLQLVHRRAYARLVYGHELLVMRKGGPAAD